MKIHFDEQADVLYLRIDDSTIVESEEVKPGVVLDLDDEGRVIGVEIRSLRSRGASSHLRPFQLDLP